MKQNQKFNSKLIFLATLLLVITFAFIFTSGCVTDDSNYTPPSAPPDIVLTPAPSNDPISGGYTDFTDSGGSNYIPPPTPSQPTNMAEVIAQQMANAESQGEMLETVPVPVPGGIVQPVADYADSSNYIPPPIEQTTNN